MAFKARVRVFVDNTKLPNAGSCVLNSTSELFCTFKQYINKLFPCVWAQTIYNYCSGPHQQCSQLPFHGPAPGKGHASHEHATIWNFDCFSDAFRGTASREWQKGNQYKIPFLPYTNKSRWVSILIRQRTISNQT